MQTRRRVLELLSAAGVAGGCTVATGPDPTAAWRNPGAGERDPRRWALAHAILAPNPHNRQPWLVELPGGNEIRLFVDTGRLLPATDPPNRQITLGCGAFLELLDLAARQSGRRAEVTLWPEGEPQPVLDNRPVAHVRLASDPNQPRDPLFAQITARHTNRQPFDLERPPTADELARVTAAAAGPGLLPSVVTDPAQRGRLIDIGWRGYLIEMRTEPTHMESARLMRIGRDEIARSPDGIALTGPMIEAMKAVGLISHEALADPDSMASKSGYDMWEKMLRGTPAFFVLRSADNSRATQIRVGRAFARAHLAATALGLSMHPWSMTLQEFPQMAGPYRETQALLGASPEAPVQMLVRIGRATAAPPAPRWPLATHILA
jgi:nitroreductase family protein